MLVHAECLDLKATTSWFKVIILVLLKLVLNILNVIYAIRILGQDFHQSNVNIFEIILSGIWRILL